MPKIIDILSYINEFAPLDICMDHDNIGLLVGKRTAEVKTIAFALDATVDIIEELAIKGVDLLITHHPILFSAVNEIDAESREGGVVTALIKNDMSLIALHTNLDICEGGVNDCLCKAIKFNNVIGVVDVTNGKKGFIARNGNPASKVTLRDFAKIVKQNLNSPNVNYYYGRGNNENTVVSKVAVVSGAGGDNIVKACFGCDTAFTGELKYHEILDLTALGKNVITAGHFATENLVKDFVINKITEKFPELNVAQCENNIDIINNVI